jgi:hypothetical protein
VASQCDVVVVVVVVVVVGFMFASPRCIVVLSSGRSSRIGRSASRARGHLCRRT